MIRLSKPHIPFYTVDKLQDLFQCGWLTEGAQTARFEAAVKKACNADYAHAVPNATLGLELMLKVMGIGEGDKVMVPNFTHPATALSVMNIGAEPILCDVDLETFNLTALPDVRNTGVRAIIPVSQFGNPVDYNKLLLDVHSPYSGRIIEDAACSVGVRHKFMQLITATVYSFHPRKVVTTGEGGMILTNAKPISEVVEDYKHFGIIDGLFDVPGSNYKMSDINATVGLHQMEYLKEYIAFRNRAAKYYIEQLEHLPVGFQKINGKSNYQTFCITTGRRDELRDYLRSKGVETQVGSYALSKLPVFEHLSTVSTLHNSIKLAEMTLALPLYFLMTKDEQNTVIVHIRNFFGDKLK